MDTDLLSRKFEAIGARVKIADPARRIGQIAAPIALDIRHDHRGEYFDLRVDLARVERLEAIDVRPAQRSGDLRVH